MMNLANAYYSRIRGDRSQNIDNSIAAHEQALQVLTREAMPVDWALSMSNLHSHTLTVFRATLLKTSKMRSTPLSSPSR